LDEILLALPKETQQQVLQTAFPEQKKPRRGALVDCLLGKSLGNSLSEFEEHLNLLKYAAQVLLTREETALTYRLLLNAIGLLGPDDPVDPGRQHDKGYYEEKKARVEKACRAFCSLLLPHSQAAYFRNRRFNRTDLLYTSGLRFPEMMHGFVWTPDLPTRVIFDEGQDLIYPPFPQGAAPPEAPGRFRVREQVDRVVGIRLSWGVSTVALFLNWRRGEAKESGQPNSAADWRPPGPNEDPAASLQSLDLAVRYFTGWLEASGLDLSQAYDKAPRTHLNQLIASLGKAARHKDHGQRAGMLTNALDNLLYPLSGGCHCNVHWTNDEPMDGHERHRLLLFNPDKYAPFAGDDAPRFPSDTQGNSVPRFPLALNSAGLVDYSVCALAGTWKIGLLIDNLDREIPGAARTWRSLHQGRAGFLCQSEIAVPLVDGDDGEVRGVVNVECAGVLKPAHLRRVELAAYLFQKLHSFYLADMPKSDRSLIDQLVDHGHPVTTFQHACKLFCQWVAAPDQLNADLAYVLIYDPRARVFRPQGITLSRELARQFLANPKESENFGRSCPDPKWLRQYEADKTDFTHSLIEHMAGARLLPKRRGLTWDIFTNKTPRDFDKPKDEGARARYIQAGLGLPFCHDRRAQADGVLWVSWGNDTGRQPTAAPVGGDAHAEQKLQRLNRVLEVVAAVYALHRYYDPDNAADPLPYPS